MHCALQPAQQPMHRQLRPLMHGSLHSTQLPPLPPQQHASLPLASSHGCRVLSMQPSGQPSTVTAAAAIAALGNRMQRADPLRWQLCRTHPHLAPRYAAQAQLAGATSGSQPAALQRQHPTAMPTLDHVHALVQLQSREQRRMMQTTMQQLRATAAQLVAAQPPRKAQNAAATVPSNPPLPPLQLLAMQ